jgi:hypothetical protein
MLKPALFGFLMPGLTVFLCCLPDEKGLSNGQLRKKAEGRGFAAAIARQFPRLI